MLPSYLRNPGLGEMSTNYKLIQNESAGAQTTALTLKPVRACQILGLDTIWLTLLAIS